MKNAITLLIDGDPLVYSCGFVAETRKHVLSWEHNGRERNATFDAAWRRDRFIELLNLHPDEYVSTPYSQPKPFGFAVRAMQTTLEGIERNVGEYLAATGQVMGGRRIYLTGANNFRIREATIRPYKGNRSAPRPYWYDQLRDWMQTHLGAIVVEGIEADDAIAIVQHKNADRTILCTVDKDLDMVPGLHYNTQRKEAWQQSREAATLAFYRQLMTGDSTDNIPGCFKVGKETARKRLALGMTEEEMYHVVLGEYVRNMDKYPEHHAPHTDPAASLAENARLLWMLRHREDRWEVPS